MLHTYLIHTIILKGLISIILHQLPASLNNMSNNSNVNYYNDTILGEDR
jgi:hypothetical protein